MIDPVAVVRRVGLLPIARGLGAADLLRAVKVLLTAGVPVLEVTMNTADAPGTIKQLHESYEGQLVLGAGTVLNPEQAGQAVSAGASFLVTPHVDPEVAATARRLDVPLISGAMTPTEILESWRSGSALVKVFPAVTLGAEYLRQLRGPLPQIPLIPTGGITAANTAEFIAAGAVAVGVGGALLGTRAKDPEWLQEQVASFTAAVRRGRDARA